jgi:hypothetical protein
MEGIDATREFGFGRTGFAAGRTVATQYYGAGSLVAQAHQVTIGQQIAFAGVEVLTSVVTNETANFISDSLWNIAAGEAGTPDWSFTAGETNLGAFTSGSPMAPYTGSTMTGFNPLGSK